MKTHSMAERDSVVKSAEAAYLRAKFLEGLIRNGEPLPRDVVFQDSSRENVRLSIFRLDGFFVSERTYVSARPGVIRGFIEVAYLDLDAVVWAMQYNGYCEETAIPFANSVLHETYRYGKFRGGRGPEKQVDLERQLMYFNLLVGSGNFDEPFSFTERIQTTGQAPEVLGHISGSGECLI